MGIKEIGILVLCFDYYIFKKFNMIRKQVMEMYFFIVEVVFEYGIILCCYFEDIIRVDFYGFVVLFVNEFMKFVC